MFSDDKNKIYLAPSLLSADFTRLAEACALIENEAQLVHCDVMDGHFVPNLTFGPPVIRALKKATKLPLDVHLMISNAEESLDWYIDAGADLITLHVEAVTHLNRALSAIKQAGRAAAISLNPGTPILAAKEALELVDMVLLMSVNPGFGGQSFIESTVRRITELKELCAKLGVDPVIQIDGGINEETIAACTKAGARCFVAGNAVFGSAHGPAAATRGLIKAAQTAIN